MPSAPPDPAIQLSRFASLTVRDGHRSRKRQKVSQDTEKQIRLISDAYGQTLDGSGAGVVGIAAAGS